MEIAGYLASVLIGISLGLIGGGGSILTVPVLVYLFYVNPVLATTYSLFVVGIVSTVGGIQNHLRKQVNFRAVWLFGLSSIITVFLARRYLLPAIPEDLQLGSIVLHKHTLLMLVFALLMMYSSYSMITCKNCGEMEKESAKPKLAALIINGLAIGLVTGLLGAGGGFLIIPALVLLLKLPMKEAVGTSLMIIAINSLLGFAFSTDHALIDWKQLLLVTGMAIVGIAIGNQLSTKMEPGKLKKMFGYFVLAMALFILVRELAL